VSARSPSKDLRVQALVQFYESLQPASIERIRALYASDASFKDPFNEVTGHAAIERIFEHMFEQVDAPRFVVESAVCEGDTAFLGWTMSYRPRGRPGPEAAIRGCSALRFDTDGRVAWHRDYWDAAEELYEKVPLLGTLMRALRRRLAATAR
jgi:steroid Delta-isomerase